MRPAASPSSAVGGSCTIGRLRELCSHLQWRPQTVRRLRRASTRISCSADHLVISGESAKITFGFRNGHTGLPLWRERPHCPERGKSGPRNGHTAQKAAKVGRGTATLPKTPRKSQDHFRFGERPHWFATLARTATLPKTRRKWAEERPHCPKHGQSAKITFGLGNGHTGLPLWRERPHCPERGESGPRNGHTAQNAAKVGSGTATKLERPHCPNHFRFQERPHWFATLARTATLPKARRKWAEERPHCPKRGESGPRNGHTAQSAAKVGRGTATLPKTRRKWAEERPQKWNGHTAQNTFILGNGHTAQSGATLGQGTATLVSHLAGNGHTASHFGKNGHTAQFTFGGTATEKRMLRMRKSSTPEGTPENAVEKH